MEQNSPLCRGSNPLHRGHMLSTEASEPFAAHRCDDNDRLVEWHIELTKRRWVVAYECIYVTQSRVRPLVSIEEGAAELMWSAICTSVKGLLLARANRAVGSFVRGGRTSRCIPAKSTPARSHEARLHSLASVLRKCGHKRPRTTDR